MGHVRSSCLPGSCYRPAQLAAPVSLAALGVLLSAESAILHTAVTAALAVAARVMAGSVLLPVGPLDGARAGKAGLLGAGGLVVAALLIGLGLL
jgi:Zn-dependent protease